MLVTIKPDNISNDSLELSDHLMSVKNYIDYGKNISSPVTTRVTGEKKFKKAFIRAKAQKISEVFAEKMLRTIDSDDPIMEKIWK